MGSRASSRLRPAVACALGAALAIGLAPRGASAARGGRSASAGLAAAKKGDCVSAVPLLEDAELTQHRPSTALALAGCYVALGDLIKASDLYHAVSEEGVSRTFTRDDLAAIVAAKKKAEAVDARIPTLTFEPADDYDALVVEVNGHPVEDLAAPKRMPAELRTTITARARGRRDLTESFVLAEGERRTVRIALEPLHPTKPLRPTARPRWIGARFQGFVVPKLLWHMFGDGGRSVFVPGGGMSLTLPTTDADFVLFLGYARYAVGDTPFKPNGAPDTDWEIVDANLSALYATASLLWSVPLDRAERFRFHFGAGVGLGWMFAGDLHRTQAYPPKGSNNVYQWQKCRGPNNPTGSFRYCNQLDADRDHYDGYAEPDWFHHGARPALYPLVTLPELALSYRPSPSFAMELGAGLSLSGILLRLGGRYAL